MFRAIEQVEHLPQLADGLEGQVLVCGPTRDLIKLGLNLQKSKIMVRKIYNGAGECQLIVNTVGSDVTPAQLNHQGFVAIPLNDFHLRTGEVVLAIQKKGVAARDFLKSGAFKKHARFGQVLGGCRMAVILPSADVKPFVAAAVTEGFSVYNRYGRVYPQRERPNPTKTPSLPHFPFAASGGDIEIAALPLAIEAQTVIKTAQQILPDYRWVAVKGSSPFNYSLVGYDHRHNPLPHEIIEMIEDTFEKFGGVVVLDPAIKTNKPNLVTDPPLPAPDNDTDMNIEPPELIEPTPDPQPPDNDEII